MLSGPNIWIILCRLHLPPSYWSLSYILHVRDYTLYKERVEISTIWPFSHIIWNFGFVTILFMIYLEHTSDKQNYRTRRVQGINFVDDVNLQTFIAAPVDSVCRRFLMMSDAYLLIPGERCRGQLCIPLMALTRGRFSVKKIKISPRPIF